MTWARAQAGRIRSFLAGITGLAGLAAVTAACGGHAAPVALPPKAGTATAAPAALTGPARTPHQVVAAAYRAYWRAYAAAMTAASTTRAESLLAPYEDSAGLPRLIGSLKRVWAVHDAAYGGAVTHVKGVQITGHRAIVHDCLDLSHFGVVNRRTGRVVPDSFGLPNQDYYVTLLLSGGRWRVANMTPVEVPCEP